jgi:PBP1b-binding outer membrane lipoprotein LpoB
MKLKKYIALVGAALFTLTSCSDYEYTPDPSYEKADISAISCYNRTGENVVQSASIVLPTRMVIAVLKPGTDVTDLKISITVSSGATVTPTLSTGFEDYTEHRTIWVTSPGKTVSKEWTLMLYPSI